MSEPHGPAQRDPDQRAPDAPPADEVRHYLRRLLLSISIGVVLMASAATWAYLTYGKKLQTGAPLPKGAPPVAGALAP